MPAPTQLPCLTIAQAAQRVGMSTWTLRRRIADGTLPASKTRNGRGIRIRPDDLAALFRPIPAAGGGPSAA